MMIDKSLPALDEEDLRMCSLKQLVQFLSKDIIDEESGLGEIEINGLTRRCLKIVSPVGEALQEFILFIPKRGYYIYAAIYYNDKNQLL